MPRRIDDAMLQKLFAVDGSLARPEPRPLLRIFAERHLADFAFLKPSDQNSAIDGIPEWDALCERFGSCERCNA